MVNTMTMIRVNTKVNTKDVTLSQRNRIEGRVLPFCMADLNLIPGIPYSPLSSPGVVTKNRTRNKL